MAGAATPSPPPVLPSIHEAALVPGPSGAVQWGRELTEAEAADRRRHGLNVVVRGPNSRANRATARRIEAAVGPAVEDPAHKGHAGPSALPHFHQVSRSPRGHTFYENASGVKARRQP